MDRGILDIETKRMTLVFEIGGDYVKMLEPDVPELKHIVGEEMAPGTLLHELQRSGIHLMPVPEDANLAGFGSGSLKQEGAEQAALTDMVCGLLGFSFRSSRWNISAPKENVVMKVRENLEYDREFFEDYEEDWTYVKWWEEKIAYVKTRDNSTEPDFEIESGHETHLCFPVIAKDKFSEEANSRLNVFSIRYQLTVKKFLTLLRLLSFT